MKLIISFFLALSFTPLAMASSPLSELQREWAIANYQTDDDSLGSTFKVLITQVDDAVATHPDDASFYIWQGIIKSSYAGKAGGLGALGLIKAAKASFEKAIEIDGAALNGSAYTSLGALYYQAPGWPIAFGDDDKASELLQKGLSINPEGLDSNFFYADFLLQQKNYQQARQALDKAQHAPARPGREIADSERQKEVSVLLTKVEKKLR